MPTYRSNNLQLSIEKTFSAPAPVSCTFVRNRSIAEGGKLLLLDALCTTTISQVDLINDLPLQNIG